jgi:glycosyltransferase involved in cell wall biosynthesis
MALTLGGIVSGLGALAGVFWMAQLAEAIRFRRRAVWLESVPAHPADGSWPAVTVIFAARNEEAMIERATRSLLDQDYPELSLIAVDDRSSDRTGAILDAIAATDRRLRVVHARDLPGDWLGKTHALHSAAERCSSPWILFTDADVIFAGEALRRAVAFAEGRGLDHLAVVPEVITESLGERVFLSMFLLMFNAYAPPRKVGDFRSKVSVGVGAFNLVRADCFRAIGGFGHIRLSVDEDMRLGQALKFAGYRGGIALGRSLVSVRWQVGLGGMIRGLEKNFFAGARYRVANVLVAVCALLVIGVAPSAGLFFGPGWCRLLCGMGIVAVGLILALMRRPGGIAPYHALLLPFGALACIVALVRSTVLALHRRGIRWRDHHYPLDQLREHARRRDEWSREVWRSTR